MISEKAITLPGPTHEHLITIVSSITIATTSTFAADPIVEIIGGVSSFNKWQLIVPMCQIIAVAL
jgi:hypothetical protein